MDVINTRLLSHPANWLIVWVVLAIASMAYKVVHDHLTGGNASISPD